MQAMPEGRVRERRLREGDGRTGARGRDSGCGVTRRETWRSYGREQDGGRTRTRLVTGEGNERRELHGTVRHVWRAGGMTGGGRERDKSEGWGATSEEVVGPKNWRGPGCS